MINRAAVVALLLAASLTTPSAGKAQTPETTVWSFDSDDIGRPPKGFSFARTGSGAPSRWVVRALQDNPSGGRVLVQEGVDSTSGRFPLAIASGISTSDLSLSVRCRMIAGRVDRACGLVLRYQDERNYYVARANALEGNVRFYAVRNGKRKQLSSWDGEVSSGVWHQLAVEASGDRFRVFWEGRPVIESRDETFQKAGGVGLWTKADSLTQFDDLTVRPLAIRK